MDITASDTFLAADTKKQREAMLQATSKYCFELEEIAKKSKISLPPSTRDWITFER